MPYGRGRLNGQIGGARECVADVPKHTGNVFAGLQQKPTDVLIGGPVDGGRDEEVFHCRRWSATFLKLESSRSVSTQLASKDDSSDGRTPCWMCWNSCTYNCRPVAGQPVRPAVDSVELRWRA